MGRDFRLILQQIKYHNRIFWRTPVGAFFTLDFPLMFLLLFTAIFGNDEIEELGVTTAQFYAPALAVFGAASATYTNLTITTAIARDLGFLKKVRGTPLPPWIYIVGRVGSAVWLALLSGALMMSVGVIFFGVEIIGRTFLAALISFLLGAGAFAALGLMLAALVSSGDAAPAVANATLLPIAFISDVFIVNANPPAWIEFAGNLFPLKHFVAAFGDAFNPGLTGSGFSWSGGAGEYAIGVHLAVMAAWGVGGAILALRFFTWEPRGGENSRRRRSRVSGN